ncbi:MAG: bifunctional DNA-formamidopyrimidine glycosylase/DNA-(apurinic or apyrimidinic site) lyase [Acidimicrobiales bacterium]|nr:bifunctional DNA-formamidopyrimidine glycosylase/DNA-(apurinic or apyrimidinic site) lyase [Acidimicrobiales bacterium]
MPELPEVETVRRQLEPLLDGRRIVDAEAHPSPKFAPAVRAVAHRVGGVRRRGKYLLFDLLDGGDTPRELVVHLGMTGGLHVVDAPSPDPYRRARWELDDGRHLVFRDVRRFGRIAVVPAGDHRSLPTLHDLGPEPFDPVLDAGGFHTRLAGSRRRVKTHLLSQRPIAGVGNIYADEALWRAGIHPGARRVGPERADLLLTALRDVLREALDHDGTTLRDYRTVDGGTGSNQFRLDCYGRAGSPCARCRTPLTSRLLDQRTATWCPSCQAR